MISPTVELKLQVTKKNRKPPKAKQSNNHRITSGRLNPVIDALLLTFHLWLLHKHLVDCNILDVMQSAFQSREDWVCPKLRNLVGGGKC